MSGKADILLWHLDDSADQFDLRLQNFKGQSKQDVQHGLQLSDGWRQALESHGACVMKQLYVRGRVNFETLKYDTNAWMNLERMLQYFRLSPMPLLHALCGLGDRMSQAILPAESALELYRQGRWKLAEEEDDATEFEFLSPENMSEAAMTLGAPLGMKIASLVNPSQSRLCESARMADQIGPRCHMVVMNGLVRYLLPKLVQSDPLALIPSLRKKLGLEDSAPAAAVIEAIQRAVQGHFVETCSTLENQCILNAIHLLRSLEYGSSVHLRKHEGRLAVWGPAILAMLKTAHLQFYTASFSPAVTIQLPEAYRKACARKQKQQSPDVDDKFAALCDKQQREAWCKGEAWARQSLPQREEVWSELVARCSLTLSARHTMQMQLQSGSLEDWCRAAMQDRRGDTKLLSLKRSRGERRGPEAPVEDECLSAANRKSAQIRVEKIGWAWPLLATSQQTANAAAAAPAAAAEAPAAAVAAAAPSSCSEPERVHKRCRLTME